MCFPRQNQLLLLVFELQDSLLPSSTGILTAEQRQTAVTAYFSSKQLLLFAFGFVLKSNSRNWLVASKQLLLFDLQLQVKQQ